ncbi:MAG: hypothetical protein A2Z31_04975 [candidate division NC10 bacterium RBG_16_65_8]|nr:MAG: hypothetical protein A2Z31_04975 [candidate division NC10 bacterium RBG_16_65_8]
MIGTVFRGGSLWTWLALALASGGVIAGIAWEVWPRTLDLSRVRPRSQASSTPVPAAAERVRVRLFFPQETKVTLVEEERDVPRRSVLADSVRGVLGELAKGGGVGTVPALPSDAEVRYVYLDAFGILYLDFGERMRAAVAGNTSRAELAVSAIVLTLTTNFSEVKRVQFLAEGQELTARVGSVDLRRPLQPHFPGEELQPIVSRPPKKEEP